MQEDLLNALQRLERIGEIQQVDFETHLSIKKDVNLIKDFIKKPILWEKE